MGENKMIKKIFPCDSTLFEFEKADLWIDAVEYVYDYWKNQKTENSTVLAIFECWYILVEHRVILKTPLTNESWYYIREIARNIVNATQDDIKERWLYNCFVGYMMSLFPEVFCETDNQYTCIEKNGKDMIKKAHNLEPDNPISKLFYLGSAKSYKEYEEYQVSMSKDVSLSFPSSMAIDEYFSDKLK